MCSYTTPHDEGDEEDECDGEDAEGTLGDPTPFVTLDDHQREESDAEHREDRTEVIDRAWGGLVTGLTQQLCTDGEGQYAQRDVDEEHRMPAEGVDEEPTNGRPAGGGDRTDCTPDPDGG